MALGVALAFTTGCKKEYDSPPERILPVGQVLTIQQLRNLYVGESISFEGDTSVYAVVNSDETSGNLYRNIYVQDGESAINLRLQNPGGLYEGDSIRIYLPGTVLSLYQGMMQLDSVDVDNNIIKQATNVPVEPMEVTVNEITPDIQGFLIKLDSVEFATSELGQTYADPIAQSNENRMLTDCDGNMVIVRSSGYANFAGTELPEGNGSMVAVVGQFGDDMQLYIRDLNDVNFDGERCTEGGGGGECDYNVDPVSSASLDFSDVTTDNADYENPQWLNIDKEGSRVWRGRVFQSSKYLRATAFGSNQVNEMWFISPPVEVSGPQLGLSFDSATAFWDDAGWDHPLTVYVSTDFDGCEIDDANWVEITGLNLSTSSTPNYDFVNSGLVNVADFLPGGFTGNVHIAFVYNGEHPAGPTTTVDLDNIQIQ